MLLRHILRGQRTSTLVLEQLRAIFDDDVPGDYHLVSEGLCARWKRLRSDPPSGHRHQYLDQLFLIDGSLE